MKKRWLALMLLLGLLLATPAWATAKVFTEHTIKGNFDGAQSVYATDVDGDGDVDVLGAAYEADDIAWWENNGSEVFTEHTITGNFNWATSVYATDVDGDGDMDVLGAAWMADDIAWWENDGNENFTKHIIAGNFIGAYCVYATDVDGDGDVDVLGATYLAADEIAWWENDGNENFTKHIITGNFDWAGSVYATDVDGDGDKDVLGTGRLADDITWWENNGNEVFTEHTIKGNFDGAASVYATDVDGDGDVDVLGAANAADDIAWWENEGLVNGSFEKGPRIPTPWKGINLTLNDKRVCTIAHSGSCSFLFIGSTANKSLKQTLFISGNTGDSFTLQGWSKAKNPSATGGAYCLEAKVFHTDATTKTYKTCFTKSTHAWQYRKKDFTTEKDYKKIEVYLRYAKQAGQAWFDDVRLIVH